jgi:TM2 domain-containing membrane protein YozV
MALNDLDRMIVTQIIPKFDVGVGKIIGLATINGERRVVIQNYANEYRYLDGQLNSKAVSYDDLKDFSAVTEEDLRIIRQNLSASRPQAYSPAHAYHFPTVPRKGVPMNISRPMAALMAFFLGWFGLHLFFLNRPTWGIIYACLCWTGIPAFFALFDTIRLLLMTDEQYAQRYGYDPSR